jgi:hypothetical protein
VEEFIITHSVEDDEDDIDVQELDVTALTGEEHDLEDSPEIECYDEELVRAFG